MMRTTLLINLVLLWLTPLNESNSDFTVLRPTDGLAEHVCYGQTLTYKCVLCGGVATVWRGTAFQCNSAANRITLAHYNLASATGECNSGEIMAYGVHVANGCYTSHINITMSHDVEGKEIQCALDSGSVLNRTLLVIGNSTIPIIEKPSTPTEVHLNVTTSDQETLVFHWAESLEPVDYYIVNATNCGVCSNVTMLPTVNCMSIEANGKRCEFSIHSVNCEIISNASDLISFPSNTPILHIISAIPYYSYSDGDLISIQSNFIESNPLQVSEGDHVSYLPAVYSIMYSDSTTGNHCYSTLMEPSSPSCISGGTCTHVFNISSSTCSHSADLRLVISARNLIGYKSLSGPELHGTNNFVRIHFNQSNFNVYCIFKNANHLVKFCSVEVYSMKYAGELCDMEAVQLGIIMLKGVNSSTTDTVSISLDTVSIYQLSEILCFTAVASDSSHQVIVRGTLSIIGSGKSEGEKLQLPLVASLSSVALLIIVGFSFGVLIVILIANTRAKTKVIRHLESEILRANNENVTYEQIDVARQSVQNQAIIHTSENIAYEHIRIRQS